MTENRRAKQIDEYYRIHPIHYRVVKSIHLSQEIAISGEVQQVLSLALSKTFDKGPNGLLYLDFYNVKKLNLSQPQLSLLTVTLLRILLSEEVSGGASGSYFVCDESQDKFISFYCDDFQFVAS